MSSRKRPHAKQKKLRLNECLYIPDVDTAKLFVQCFRPLAQCAVSLKSLKCIFIIIRLWVVALGQLKNKAKVQLSNPKSGRGRLREGFITKFKSQFKQGFTKLVVTRAGRLLEWSQGELRLYSRPKSFVLGHQHGDLNLTETSVTEFC